MAVVTGASSGLGERFARVLAGVGAHVVLVARRTERIEALADLLPDALAVTVDVADDDGPQALVDATLAHYGRLDVLVNNAGISRVVPAVDDDLDGFRHELAVDLVAPYELSRRAARWWIDHDHPGVVVNLGSVMGAGSGGRLRIPGYAAAKGGLHNLTRELAVQWARKGIRVNAIAPGTTLTETVAAAFTEERMAALVAATPLRRMVEHDELARLAVFLCSDLARCITGQFLLADAGAFLSRSRPANNEGLTVSLEGAHAR